MATLVCSFMFLSRWFFNDKAMLGQNAARSNVPQCRGVSCSRPRIRIGVIGTFSGSSSKDHSRAIVTPWSLVGGFRCRSLQVRQKGTAKAG
jgi:hypothetical protein